MTQSSRDSIICFGETMMSILYLSHQLGCWMLRTHKVPQWLGLRTSIYEDILHQRKRTTHCAVTIPYHCSVVECWLECADLLGGQRLCRRCAKLLQGTHNAMAITEKVILPSHSPKCALCTVPAVVEHPLAASCMGALPMTCASMAFTSS